MEKNPLLIFKSGGILEKKKSKSPQVAGTFFETWGKRERGGEGGRAREENRRGGAEGGKGEGIGRERRIKKGEGEGEKGRGGAECT